MSYERFLWGQEVEPVAAALISGARLRQLLRGYDATAAALDTEVLAAALASTRSARGALLPLVAQRDAAVIAYLHASWQRGGEGGRLRLCDMEPSPLSWFEGAQCTGPFVVPSQVTIFPNGTKCAQRRNAGSLTLTPVAGDRAMCCLYRIGCLLQVYHSVGVVLTPTSPVFVACNSGGHRLTPSAMTYGAIYRRLKHGLRETHSGPSPQTPHSFRRTGLVSGVDDPSASMAHALMRTPAVFRRYTDAARAARGSPRVVPRPRH